MNSYLLRAALLLSLVGLFCMQAPAQNETKGSLNSGKLEQQFEYLMKKSNRFQEFKVVKKDWLYTFWSHVSDSLSQSHSSLNETMAALGEKEQQISGLQEQITSLTGQLDEVTNQKDSISFLGANWNKASYKNTMWGIIFGLIGLCAFVFFRFMRSNTVTRESLGGLKKVQDEFEDYRKKALSKEQTLKRELQDELNKNYLNKAS